MLSDTNLFILLLVAIIGLLIIFNLKTCYFPALFFLIKFLARFMFDFDHFRNNVVFQLIVIIILIFVIFLRENGIDNIKDICFSPYIFLILGFLSFNIFIGIILGHDIFQCFIDSYKYIEILIYYFLVRLSWKNLSDVYSGIIGLTVIMIILGFIEIFTTDRGGVGLNIIISVFPMALLLLLEKQSRSYLVLFILSFLVVILCKTRTYIVGFFIGYFLLLLIANKSSKVKLKVITTLSIFFVIFFVVVLGGSLFTDTFDRFLELFNDGFSESGGYRIDEYIYALQKFAESPVIGNGFGYLEYVFINKLGFSWWGDFIHNVYIEILFKTGILGFVFVLIIFGSFIAKLIRYLKKYKTTNQNMFAIVCGGIVATISWLWIYAFAPLSSYGSIFLGSLIASIAIDCYEKNPREIMVRKRLWEI